MRKLSLLIASCILVSGAFGQKKIQNNKLPIPQYNVLNVAPSFNDHEQLSLEYIKNAKKTESGHIRCFTSEHEQIARSINPGAETVDQFESWISQKIKELPNNSQMKATRNIPVVVHVLYANSTENISDAQIQSQIDVLNEDFSATNSDFGNTPAVFQSVAANCDIQFCLASTDPNGQPTNGINRVSVSSSPLTDTQIDNTYKPSTIWDPNQYLNIWVANISGSILGYATFPTGSGLPGLFAGEDNTNSGVVILYSAMGRTGTVFAPYNKGRTATHEVGHWLGLRHIWGDSNCGDDFCNDTPTQQTDNGGCPSFPSPSCGNSGDMSMNYMDYVNDACMYMFTADQKLRMDAVLQNSPRRATLLSSTKCNAAAITADFTADVTTINVGGSVNFTDQSSSPNTLNSWNWSFPGGSTTSFNGQNPPAITYNAVGQYDVSLTVTDNASGTDTETKVQYINVVNAGACDTLLNIPDTDTARLYQTDASGDYYASGYNQYGLNSHAEKYSGFSPYTYVTGGWFWLYDIVDGGNGASVDFNVWNDGGSVPGTILGTVTYSLSEIETILAGAPVNQGLFEVIFDAPINVGAGPFYIGVTLNGFGTGDKLGIISNSVYDPTPNSAYTLYNGNWYAYNNLFTAPSDYSLFISPYMSIDAPTADIVTNTTTICAGESVNFDASSSTNTTGYDWVFNGGTPSTSTNTTESVAYSSAGSPRAYLIAYGNCGSYALDSVDISVTAPTNTPTFTQVSAICQGDALSALPTTSNNSITGSWSPALDNMNTTTYTFTPDAGQCATTTTMTITVNSPTTPTFTQVSSICQGDALSALPTTSNNSITGSWSPALDNMNTTTYTFTPNAGQCASSTQMTITVNTPTTPTFTQVSPICQGDALSALPTTSNNSITGSWSPALDNMNTTTYTFTPNAGQCATTTTMTINVNTSPTTPTFTQVSSICQGDALSALPTTSNNSITGSWSPALDNMNTTTYTFTPNAGQCASSTQMTITVNTPTTPTFTQVSSICQGDALSALPNTSNNSITGSWSPALDNMNTTTYTFTPDAGQCATTTTMTITVTAPTTTPTFTQVSSICQGDALSALPTTSNNSITGSWSPALDNMNTTTYTFTPNAGQCATTTTMTITVNAPTTPTFTQVSSICQGDALSALPTTSNNSITGSWSPALDNMNTTTYTFTPNAGQCATTTTMTIVVNTPGTTPTFTQVSSICQGDALSALPTTSNNSITGSWSPALDNMNTTTYTFTPDAGQCAISTTMTITVNNYDVASISYPKATYCITEADANPNQTGVTGGSYTSSPSGLVINGTSGIIGVSASSAGAYTVSYTTSGVCPTVANTSVVIDLCTGIAQNTLEGIKIYPNPVSSILTIESAKQDVDQISLINILGETLITKKTQSTVTTVNVEDLSMGVYFIQLFDKSGSVISTQKVSIK